MSRKIKPYPCANCGGEIHDAPVNIEALCWRCWWTTLGEYQAVREWKRRHWWRRMVP